MQSATLKKPDKSVLYNIKLSESSIFLSLRNRLQQLHNP